MLTQTLLTGIWGGLLALERRAFLQAALSRPLPAATGVGALLGDVTSGVMVGLIFELLHLGAVSLGGHSPDHETIPAVTGAAFAASAGEASGANGTPAMWALAVLVWAPMGPLGRVIDGWLDVRARRYLGRVVKAAEEGNVELAVRQNLRAMWPHFMAYGALTSIATLAGATCGAVLDALPLVVSRGLAWAFPVIGTVAAAAAVHASQGQGRLRVAAVVALVVALVFLGTLGARAW